jgi:hypothetical protein
VPSRKTKGDLKVKELRSLQNVATSAAEFKFVRKVKLSEMCYYFPLIFMIRVLMVAFIAYSICSTKVGLRYLYSCSCIDMGCQVIEVSSF